MLEGTAKRSWCPTHMLKQGCLQQVVLMASEYFQGWKLHSPSKKTVPELGHSHPVYCLLLRPDTEINRTICKPIQRQNVSIPTEDRVIPQSNFRQNSNTVDKTHMKIRKHSCSISIRGMRQNMNSRSSGQNPGTN